MTNQEFINKLVRDGVSADELTKMLNEAEAKIAAEKAEKEAKEKAKREKEQQLADLREELAMVYIDYYIARGLINEPATEEDYDKLADTFVSLLKSAEEIETSSDNLFDFVMKYL